MVPVHQIEVNPMPEAKGPKAWLARDTLGHIKKN